MDKQSPTPPEGQNQHGTLTQPAAPQVSQSSAETVGRPWGKVWVWSAWAVYVGYLLLSDLPPGPSLLQISPETLREAWELSLNFWLVLPMLFPSEAPVLHPALEGLFNVTVTWGLLFWGFAVDGRQQRVPILPFLLGTAFLTNVFYLPWLGLRRAHCDRPSLPLNRLEAMTESRAYPLVLFAVILASLAWAAVGRAGFGEMGDRWAELVNLVQRDRSAGLFVLGRPAGVLAVSGMASPR